MALHKDGPSPAAISSHVSEPVLQPFLQRNFDAADYLNSALPNLSSGVASSRSTSTNTASLADILPQAQTLLSQLNAQASRLTAVLTQLTDDIIRSGSRLAYEVDVLRAEALGLSEVINDGLIKEISMFTKISVEDVAPDGSSEENENKNTISEPQYISQLRMLNKVRERLDSVIKIFGEAMHWTLPPSDMSVASSFISVSAPETSGDSQSREQKGKEFAERLRAEIADVLLNVNDAKAGFAVAQARIDALRTLSQVWKGTAEEKARIRFVDSLVKLAEDRMKELEKPGYRMTSARARVGAQEQGFMENLQKLQTRTS